MAELILSYLLPIVFEKLTSAALNKVARSTEIQSQLKKLKTSLPKIEALLNDAAEKEIQDRRVKDWLKSLQHVAYDIDDILDSLATDAIHSELTEKPAAGGFTRKVRKIIPACCTTILSPSNTEMHDKLNDIITKLQELYNERKDLGLKVKDKRSKNINRIYQTSLLPPGIDIVGRQGEKEFLLEKLLADHEPHGRNNFSVVPIVGMGGIGKTTLARLLYNEPKVEQHFDLKVWVCVSDEFDSFNIGKVIFQSIVGEEKKEKEFKDLNLLHVELKKELAGNKFLLVLDDVWSEKIEDWETLVPPFDAAAAGSKIIITTRKTELLQKLGNENPYHLNKLSDNDALSLFAEHALGAPNFDLYPFLKQYGEGIVQKCDGLPLALKSLGTSLKTKTDEEDWNELLKSTIWNLKDEGGILPALRISYQELSACLKQLFAYSCLFPKDYVFEKEDLIMLWMAEGFLHESTEGYSMDMERLGEIYFNELLSKSFFEYANNDKSLFVMHDLFNDLATSVAGEFFVRLDIETKNKTEEHSLKKYRHMSFVCEKFMGLKKFKSFESANNLRTFLAVPVVVVRDGWKLFNLSNKILVDLLPQFPLLRALCLSKLNIDEVPDSVGDLKHLRYLNVSQTYIRHLPETVCNLYNLQTLIVFGCPKLSDLPSSFLKLKNLRHLDIRDTPRLKNMPLGIGEMKSLQTLSKIVIGGENEFPISELKKLKNLRRRVCIDGLDKLQNNDQAREVSLSQMRLCELVVGWSDVFDGSRNQRLEKEVLDVLKPHQQNLKNLEITAYGGKEFPKWVGDSYFSQLTDVSIEKCRNCSFLPPLGQLPSLKKLLVRNMDVKVVGSELLGNGLATFPSLEVLRFKDMPWWLVWSFRAVGRVAVFPCLKELWIENCPKLVKVSLEALPTLRVLRVNNCCEDVLKSLAGAASSVTKLYIAAISGLHDEVWGGVVQSLGALEELQITDCNEMINMWESEEEAEEGINLPTSLRMLRIEYCKNLKHLSCPDSIETLDINNCENLKHLSCPGNNIQELRISNCRSITSVSFPTEGRGGGGGWQKLKTLEIMRCKSEVLEKELEKQVLNIIPMLQVFRILGSQYLKSLTKYTSSFTQQLTRLEVMSCPMIIESFPDLQNLTSLKHLGITNCPGMDGPPPPLPLTRRSVGVWPLKLESLRIGNLKRPISEWGPLPNSLVQLELWGGFGGSSAEAEEDVKSFPTSSLVIPASLVKLELYGFKKMERISSEGLQHLTSLQHLTIITCPKLKNLPETLLPSLLSLTILQCPNEELKEKMMSERSGSYWPLLSYIPKVKITDY